jgi:hypothetical protein
VKCGKKDWSLEPWHGAESPDIAGFRMRIGTFHRLGTSFSHAVELSYMRYYSQVKAKRFRANSCLSFSIIRLEACDPSKPNREIMSGVCSRPAQRLVHYFQAFANVNAKRNLPTRNWHMPLNYTGNNDRRRRWPGARLQKHHRCRLCTSASYSHAEGGGAPVPCPWRSVQPFRASRLCRV